MHILKRVYVNPKNHVIPATIVGISSKDKPSQGNVILANIKQLFWGQVAWRASLEELQNQASFQPKCTCNSISWRSSTRTHLSILR